MGNDVSRVTAKTKQLQILIKPVSGDCNISCGYCFYRDEMQHRRVTSRGRMSRGVRDRLIECALKEAQESCVFAFQGGEPLLAGLPFFEEFISRVSESAPEKLKISYVLQTNGLLLNDAWIAFFKENNFLLGVSLDGPKGIHDKQRTGRNAEGTFLDVMDAIRRIRENGIPCHVLTVLTAGCAAHIDRVYSFFKKQGILQQQYIPCLEPLGAKRGSQPWSLMPQQYGAAVKRLFDLWWLDRQKGENVYIRQFDNWITVLRGGRPEACGMYGKCSMQNVVEADGDIYPCDFYALDEYRVGNIMDMDFGRAKQQAEEGKLLREGSTRGEECAACRWYPLCRGGCYRDYETELPGARRNAYCAAYRDIFPYVIERLEYLAARF